MKEGCSLEGCLEELPKTGLKGRAGVRRDSSWAYGTIMQSLGRQKWGKHLPRTLRTMTPNFLSPRAHFHRKDQMTLRFRLWSLEPLKKQRSVA